MASSDPEILIRSGSNTGLVVTISISALLHVAVIALLIALPRRFLGAAPPLESYTVDLVAPGVLGGTNLKAGKGGGRRAAPPAQAPASAPKVPAAERVKVAAVKPRAAEKPRAVEDPKPKSVEEPKPAPAAAKPAAAEKPPREAAKPPAAEEKEVAPKPVAKQASKKVPEPPAKESAPKTDAAVGPVPAPAAEKKPSPPPVAKKAAPASEAAKAEPPKEAAKSEAKSPPAAEGVDAKIARAVAARAAQLGSETPRDAPAAADVDSQIAAAVRRRIVEQIGAGGTEGQGADDGGPISTGPGVGAGGEVRDLEYIAYRSQMEARIKESWAWAGPDRSLVAVIGFNITPEGQIVNVQTVQSSGDPSYDASAVRAVEQANPLGAPPEKYQQEFWSVELEFRPDESRS